MMQGRDLIRATMPFTVENQRLSWLYFLTTLALMCMAFFITALPMPWWGRLIFSILAGLTASRMFALYHDFQHSALLRASKIAGSFMEIFGLLALAPRSIWNDTHEHHHKYNSRFSTMVVGSFPIVTKKEFLKASRIQQIKYLVIRHPLMILFAYVPVFLISFCFLPFLENPRKYLDCGLAIILHGLMIGALFLFGGFTLVLFTALIPALIFFMLGAYIFYAQHNFAEVQLVDDDQWDYVEAALWSSSYIRMNRIMRWFTANIGYHHVHHINSRIPFYRLPEVMQTFPELRQPGTTSMHPAEIWKCLKLKVWDSDQKRMITLKELY